MNKETPMERPRGVAGMSQAYDPAFSYVVIEHRLEAREEEGFQPIDEALSGLKTDIVDQALVTDPSTGKKRLVIKMKQQETEEIMLAFLGTGLKENFRCYVY
jgi:hypothetical protein